MQPGVITSEATICQVMDPEGILRCAKVYGPDFADMANREAKIMQGVHAQWSCSIIVPLIEQLEVGGSSKKNIKTKTRHKEQP